ncbi:MAG: hypothetical protein KJ709_01950 [Nanoarchaeota archaeon]|nr:hypothetical protein [Nanoarchaeota archaeon]
MGTDATAGMGYETHIGVRLLGMPQSVDKNQPLYEMLGVTDQRLDDFEQGSRNPEGLYVRIANFELWQVRFAMELTKLHSSAGPVTTDAAIDLAALLRPKEALLMLNEIRAGNTDIDKIAGSFYKPHLPGAGICEERAEDLVDHYAHLESRSQADDEMDILEQSPEDDPEDAMRLAVALEKWNPLLFEGYRMDPADTKELRG